MTQLHWSQKYLNIPWLWSGATTKGTDCRGLVFLALKQEQDFEFEEETPNDTNCNYDMIERAVKYGELIKDYRVLREFDVVFFIIDGDIKHMGIMVDKFGRFLHQLDGRVSRISNINEKYWKNKFYAAVRRYKK